MRIQKKEDGTLLVPQRIESDGIIGDATVEIKPDNEDYAKYLREYEREQDLSH